MKPSAAYFVANIRRVDSHSQGEDRVDLLAVEEPLEIRLGYYQNGKLTHRPISITMRTPGDDMELAAGFLFTEGIVKSPDQVADIRHCGSSRNTEDAVGSVLTQTTGLKNTIVVTLSPGVEVDMKRLERHFYTSSSCGVCGKSSIESLHTGATKLGAGTLEIDPGFIHRMPEALLSRQETFEKTGGLHASVIFDEDGSVDTVREDVGRHNALDKVIGAKFLAGEMPLSDKVLMVSGRASFELVQKALMAGMPILAAVGAPSSLAVELAREFNMTLIGFVRENRFNIYTGGQRIQTPVIGSAVARAHFRA